MGKKRKDTKIRLCDIYPNISGLQYNEAKHEQTAKGKKYHCPQARTH